MGRCWLMKIAITISRVLGITYKAESWRAQQWIQTIGSCTALERDTRLQINRTLATEIS
jgi:hypothetical protein